MADRGALIIADISGYAKFVGGVELEHGAAIVADLLSVAVEQLAGVESWPSSKAMRRSAWRRPSPTPTPP